MRLRVVAALALTVPALCVLAGCSPGVGIDDGSGLGCRGAVAFGDPALEARVVDVLGYVEDEETGEFPPVMARDLVRLSGLSARELGVTSLRGLECAQGLETLGLSGNQISDLSPLAELGALRELELSENDLERLTPIRDLPLRRLIVDANPLGNRGVSDVEELRQLDHLDVSRTSLSSLEGLAGLRDLQTLSARDNAIDSIAPLAGLDNLLSIDVEDNEIEEIEAVAGKSLRRLDIDANLVESLEPLQGMQSLEYLDARANVISSVAPLSGLSALVDLDLADNALASSEGLDGLVSLEALDISDNSIAQIDGLAGGASLRRVFARNNDLESLEPLSSHDQLGRLDVRGNPAIDSLEIVDQWPLLSWIGAGGEGVDLDLAPLTQLAIISTVVLADVGAQTSFEVLPTLPITTLTVELTPLEPDDFADIALSTTLLGLTLRECGLSDLQPLTGLLSTVKRLTVAGNEIEDLGPVATLEVIEVIEAADNPVADLEFMTDIEGLTRLDVRRSNVESLAPAVADPGFRSGDRLDVRECPLSETACPDVLVLRERDVDLATSLECE